MTQIDVKAFITKKSVTKYIAHSELVACESVPKNEKNRAVCITHLSLKEETALFAESLIRSIKPFTYSQDKLARLKKKILDEEGIPEDEIDQYITQKTAKLFRKDNIEGQLGELILYVILEQYFESIPVIRKMPITTDPNLERNGADAIHLKVKNGKYELIIGEAKTYSRLTKQTGAASTQPSYRGFKDSIESALTSLNTLWDETEVYLMHDFVPENVRDVVQAIKKKEISHSILICCICVYEFSHPAEGCDEDNIKAMHLEADEAIKKFINSSAYSSIPSNILPKFCFISFPIANMTTLKESFQCKL